jgi:hypothetical protein
MFDWLVDVELWLGWWKWPVLAALWLLTWVGFCVVLSEPPGRGVICAL